jgi:hypothetical protein
MFKTSLGYSLTVILLAIAQPVFAGSSKADEKIQVQNFVRELFASSAQFYGHNSCGQCRVALLIDEEGNHIVKAYTLMPPENGKDAFPPLYQEGLTEMHWGDSGCGLTEIKVPEEGSSSSQNLVKNKGVFKYSNSNRSNVLKIDYEIANNDSGGKSYKIKQVKTSQQDDDYDLGRGGNFTYTQNCIIDGIKYTRQNRSR